MPGDGALEQVARARGALDLAEAQRVEDRDRPRADREDVAQDPADAGGGALERLDRARVVVRLDLERARQPAAERHRAGVLARAHQHARALGGQRAQQLLGVLVGAVLGPHQREDGELDLVGLALHVLDDAVVLRRRVRPELAVARGDRHAASAAAAPTTERNSSEAVDRPVSGSTACSGCGIRPTTLPAALETPAMSRAEPFGFSPGRVAERDLAGGLELVEHRVGRVVAAGRVLDGDRERLAGRALARPRRVGARHRHADLPAEEAQARVRQQRAGQQPRLAQDLEAVADAEHRAARAGEALDLLHHRREARDRADPQVVAVGEAAGDDDRVGAAQVVVGVPEQLGVADPPRRLQRVHLVTRAGEADDADLQLPPQGVQPCVLRRQIGIRP